MAIQPTRPEAYDTGTLSQYAHIYDVQAEELRARKAEEAEQAARIAADEEEKEARIAADDAEKQARIAADEELSGRIDTEISDRKIADNELKEKIDSINVIAPKQVDEAAKASGSSLSIGNSALCTSLYGISIGNNSNVSGANAVAIGNGTNTNGHYSIAIGNNASCKKIGSIAIGAGSGDSENTLRQNSCFGDSAKVDTENCIGAVVLGSYSKDAGSYTVSVGNDTTKREIRNVGAPTKDDSAATKNYVDTSIASIPATPIATASTAGIVKASDSIIVADDGTAKVNPEIFGDGLSTTDGKVSVDTGFVGEHLAGDALYYDSTDGLMVKTGTGLHIDNDTLSVDQDTLPLASAANRGTVKVGDGLAIAKDGTLNCTVKPSVPTNTLTISRGKVGNLAGQLIDVDRSGEGAFIYNTLSGYREKWFVVYAGGATIAQNLKVTYQFTGDEGDGIDDNATIFLYEAIVPSSGSHIPIKRSVEDGVVTCSFTTDAAISANTSFTVHMIYGLG